MPWEQRENRKYYYRKVRTGNHVQSIYIGEEHSNLANAMHTLEELFRAAAEEASAPLQVTNTYANQQSGEKPFNNQQ